MNTIPKRKETTMQALLVAAAILAIWIVLNAWVLPKLGVNT